jgi:hypothetical protein
MRAVMMRSDRKPGSTRRSSAKLRISNPAPMTNSTATATSPITNRLAARPNEALEPRSSALRQACTSDRDDRTAGMAPKPRPVSALVTSVKPRTQRSRPISSTRGMSADMVPTNTCTPRYSCVDK